MGSGPHDPSSKEQLGLSHWLKSGASWDSPAFGRMTPDDFVSFGVEPLRFHASGLMGMLVICFFSTVHLSQGWG